MNKIYFWTKITVMLTIPFLSLAKTVKKSNPTSGEVIPNVVVIKFKDGQTIGEKRAFTGFSALDSLLRQNRIFSLEQVVKPEQLRQALPSSVNIQSIYYAYYEGNRSPVEIAKALSENPLIEYAEPKYVHHPFVIPNDTLFIQQSYLNVIKAPQAWDIVKGEQGKVIVAIVDGGTDITHPDIQNNLWSNPGEIANNGLDDDGNGYVDDIHGWNFANNSNNPKGLPATPLNANHGTQTAGLACAVTNNITGIAGTSWNATLMPINVSSPNTDRTFEFGFEGIMYAAINGADIISLSWGRTGGSSQFEQDMINFAVDQGAAIVAAAGNDNTSAPGFPASYDNVLSVAATNNNDVKAFFSNFGPKIDVSAPGVNILSTRNNGQFGASSGTSFSCPIVSGVAALVKTQHPDWVGVQVEEQVRVTADNIDAINPSFAGQLGRGRVNAFRAVTEVSPSIRITNVEFTETSGDGVIEPGETVQVTLTLRNYLAPASNVNLKLKTNDSFVFINNDNATIANVGTLQEVRMNSPFVFTVLSFAPSGHPVNFEVEINSGTYQDRDQFILTILPTFGNITINNVDVTVTNIGRIGFADPNNSSDGVGFKFKNGPNLLFEGALIMGTGPTQISNAARGLLFGSNLRFDKDFTVASGGDLQILTPGNITDQESIGIFEDTQATNPMHLRITQETFAMKSPPNDDFILFRYTIENTSQTNLQNFYFGIFFDWDIDGGTFATNKVEYDADRRMGYAFDTGQGPRTFVGMEALSEGPMSFRAIFNDPNDPNNPSWGLYDGYTDSEKWESISSGIKFTEAGPADVSFVIAQGPFTIESNSFIQLSYALLAGENLADLQSNADSARTLWNQLFTTAVTERPSNKLPDHFVLEQNFPNPFNPETTIHYQIPKATEVEITIFNLRGQKIRTLVKQNQPAGFYSVQWDGTSETGQQVANGVYLYKLKAGDFIQTRKMLLLK